MFPVWCVIWGQFMCKTESDVNSLWPEVCPLEFNSLDCWYIPYGKVSTSVDFELLQMFLYPVGPSLDVWSFVDDIFCNIFMMLWHLDYLCIEWMSEPTLFSKGLELGVQAHLTVCLSSLNFQTQCIEPVTHTHCLWCLFAMVSAAGSSWWHLMLLCLWLWIRCLQVARYAHKFWAEGVWKKILDFWLCRWFFFHHCSYCVCLLETHKSNLKM